MSDLQKLLYQHMYKKGVLLTDGSEKDKKVNIMKHFSFHKAISHEEVKCVKSIVCIIQNDFK